MANPTWDDIRSPSFADRANAIICDNPPPRRSVRGITPLPGSRYAVFRVTLDDGSRHAVRIGALESPAEPVTGFLGTTTAGTGQAWQMETARAAAADGAPVLVPDLVAESDGVEVMWTALVADNGIQMTAAQWHRLLGSMPVSQRPTDPVFTHRAAAMECLSGLDHSIAAPLGDRYDLWLETLFEEATKWSLIHSDAERGHVRSGAKSAFGGNGAILISPGFLCWAPVVWGLMSLPEPARGEALRLGGFSRDEVDAALRLRAAADDIAAGVKLSRAA